MTCELRIFCNPLCSPSCISVLDRARWSRGPPRRTNTSLVYIGTYTEEGSTSKGIYVYRFDASTVTITSLGLAAQTINPSFLAVHPNHRFLYAVNEVKRLRGPKERSRQRLRDQSRDRQTDSPKSSGVQAGRIPVTSPSTKPESTFWWRIIAAATWQCFPCLRMADWVRFQPLCSTPATARIRSARKDRTPTPSTYRPTTVLPSWTISASMKRWSTNLTASRLARSQRSTLSPRPLPEPGQALRVSSQRKVCLCDQRNGIQRYCVFDYDGAERRLASAADHLNSSRRTFPA